MKNILIVGAGIAGLSLARKLIETYPNIILIEKEKRAGGLAKSFKYNNITFDIGPHRFYTEDKEVTDFIHDVLKDNILNIRRYSGMWFSNKYYDWPFNYKAVFQLPFSIKVSAFFDLFKRFKEEDKDYKDFVISRYGKTIYEHFFIAYTKKFMGLYPEEIDFDWGKESIDRAVIDRRIKAGSIFDLLRSLFIFRPIRTEFIYPKRGGIGAFTEKIADHIQAKNAKILVNTVIKRIEIKKGKIISIITDKKIKIPVKELIWTAPITDLADLLDIKNIKLKFIDTMLYNIEVDQLPDMRYQWCYFGDPKFSFVRFSIPFHFSRNNASDKRYGICVEKTLTQGDTGRSEMRAGDTIINELIRAGIIPDKKTVKDMHTEKISNTYPVYELNYRKELETLKRQLKEYKNLHLLGRCGTFWYNNMDHSIKQALTMKLLKE